MALSLANISQGAAMQAPRLLVYGPHGVGKTSFGAGAPNPILVPFEEGLGKLQIPVFTPTDPASGRPMPRITSYADGISALQALHNEPHEFKTAIIDTADWLEPLVWQATCEKQGWTKGIEEQGFGKGYVAADDQWNLFLQWLDALRNNRGMQIIMLAHAEVKTFNDPTHEPYDRYTPKLHKRASALLQEWADAVLFLNYKTFVTSDRATAGFNKGQELQKRGVGTGQRVLHTEERPSHLAKNRYGLPPEMELPNAAGAYKVFLDALMKP